MHLKDRIYWERRAKELGILALGRVNLAIQNIQNYNRKLMKKAILRVLKDVDDYKALDCGCGVGWLVELINSLGYEIIAFDIAKEIVNIASQRLNSHDIHFLCADVRNLSFVSNYFDLVVSIKNNFERAIKEIVGVTKPGGNILIIESMGRFQKKTGYTVYRPKEMYVDLFKREGCDLIDQIKIDSALNVILSIFEKFYYKKYKKEHKVKEERSIRYIHNASWKIRILLKIIKPIDILNSYVEFLNSILLLFTKV